MNKKAMEMTFNTLIIAVIALIILAVSLYFILGTNGDVDDATKCVRKGGICKESCDDNGYVKSVDSSEAHKLCGGEKEYCCSITPKLT